MCDECVCEGGDDTFIDEILPTFSLSTENVSGLPGTNSPVLIRSSLIG